MSKPSLDEFLQLEAENLSLYVVHKTLDVYVRKGRRRVDDQIVNALTRANTTNIERRHNINTEENHTRTGLYKEFDDLMFQKAIEYGYDGVFVECVLTPFLRDALLRYGYRRVNISEFEDHHYWRSVKDETK
jgi:hypothetical protein